MTIAGARHFCLLAAILFLGGVVSTSLAEDAPTPPESRNPIHLKWLDSLDTGYLQAQRTGRPILVLVEDGPDPDGRRTIDTVESAIAQDHLSIVWPLVHLDLRKSKDAVRALGVATAPAICIISADGKIVGMKQDQLDEGSLSQWFRSMGSAANWMFSDSDSRRENIKLLASQDETTRESAVRRLENDRDAAGEVVELLFNGRMSVRLAALDVLEQWGAPLRGIDPWDPSTLTSDHKKMLEKWAKSPAPTSRTSHDDEEPSALTEDLDVELDALLDAPTDIEARAIREQMVHFGPAALPEIRRRIGAVSSNGAKQRLMALRYRLVASDRLAQDWPGGFDRLASNDPFARRSAVDELSKHVQSEDSRLLVELFSDNDEFVRERSLRMLRSVGGADSTRALIHLLDDPEPNVRAAVLKTLGENPDPSLASDLAHYARTEKDADLVVHCIRVLQDIPGDEAVYCLRDMLSHPAWRVRAEACQAIHQKMQSGSDMDPAQVAALLVSLTKCLNDSDQFVISQAAIALASFNLPAANDALMKKGMDRNPVLAVDVLNSLGRDRASTELLMPTIRRLVSNPKPQIRASAILAVCRYAPETAGDEVAAGLKDPDPGVRQAAATGIASVLEELFPVNGTVYAEAGNYGSAQHNVDVKQWVADFVAGTGRPDWMTGLKPTLEKMIADPDEQSRVAAAMSLCALGGATEAWPVLLKSADSEIARGTEAAALPWLDWDKRKQLWDRLVPITPDGQMPRLIDKFAAVPDQRAVAPLWGLLRDPPRDALLEPVYESQIKFYGVNDRPMVNEMMLASQPLTPGAQKCVDDTRDILLHGGELQKVEALCLLAQATPIGVIKPAGEIYRDKKNAASLRVDAFQILLLSMTADKAEPIAAEAIADPDIRKIAVTYLALGNDAIESIRQRVYIYRASVVPYGEGGLNQADPIIQVHVPAGLVAAPLLELLSDRDQDVVGCAGYLLTILGDRRGLDPLLHAAEAHGFDDDNWGKLAYRAISKLDDDSETPVLERIYVSFGKQSWKSREFYWTIRAMHGPNVLKLRKKIRDEVGMQQLQ